MRHHQSVSNLAIVVTLRMVDVLQEQRPKSAGELSRLLGCSPAVAFAMAESAALTTNCVWVHGGGTRHGCELSYKGHGHE
jgi:hypothetical protein